MHMWVCLSWCLSWLWFYFYRFVYVIMLSVRTVVAQFDLIWFAGCSSSFAVSFVWADFHHFIFPIFLFLTCLSFLQLQLQMDYSTSGPTLTIIQAIMFTHIAPQTNFKPSSSQLPFSPLPSTILTLMGLLLKNPNAV